jgi:hypothetical protein
MNKYEIKQENFMKRWLLTTTCFYHSKRFITWKSQTGRFILAKHSGHSEYCGRGTGTSHCGTHYDLYDLDKNQEVLESDSKYYEKQWCGRWSKSKQKELEEMVLKLEMVN